MTAPIIPGKRYEISPPDANADELNSLGGLINFLNAVGDHARLRAKDENGIRFLHTRTGTPLGRFWKWLTVAWPEAKAQRILFKNSVRELLENIQKKHANDVDISSLKDRILNETLEVRNFSEFDLTRLKGDLHELHKALEKKRTHSAVSAATSAEKGRDKPPAMILIAKQKPSGSEDDSFSEQASGQVEADSGPASLSSVGKTGRTAKVIDTQARGTHVLKTMGKEGPSPDSESDEESAETPSSSARSVAVSVASVEMPILQEFEGIALPAEPRLAAPKLAVPPDAGTIESTWPESSKTAYQAPPPQPQPRRLQAGSSAETGAVSGLGEHSSVAKSILPLMPAQPPESTITEGKLEIFQKANSGSRFAMIGLLEADAYLFPSGGNAGNPNEKLLLDSVQTAARGVQVFRGQLEGNDSSRRWGMLVMEGPASSSSLADEQKWNALYTQYLKALEEAVALRIDESTSVRTIAIRPWKEHLLSDQAAQILIRAVHRFREQHPGITVRIVPSATGEERKLQTALQAVGKDSGPPMNPLSS